MCEIFYHKTVRDTKQNFKENKMIFVLLQGVGGAETRGRYFKKIQGTGMLQKKSVLPQAFGVSQNICRTAIPF